MGGSGRGIRTIQLDCVEANFAATLGVVSRTGSLDSLPMRRDGSGAATYHPTAGFTPCWNMSEASEIANCDHFRADRSSRRCSLAYNLLQTEE
jgi:hypothetical protein